MRMFAVEGRACIRHGSAHILPATRNHTEAVRAFLEPFLASKAL